MTSIPASSSPSLLKRFSSIFKTVSFSLKIAESMFRSQLPLVMQLLSGYIRRIHPLMAIKEEPALYMAFISTGCPSSMIWRAWPPFRHCTFLKTRSSRLRNSTQAFGDVEITSELHRYNLMNKVKMLWHFFALVHACDGKKIGQQQKYIFLILVSSVEFFCTAYLSALRKR